MISLDSKISRTWHIVDLIETLPLPAHLDDDNQLHGEAWHEDFAPGKLALGEF